VEDRDKLGPDGFVSKGSDAALAAFLAKND
jgi:hypothetical protein